MLNGLIGRISAVAQLKQGLDDSSVRSRQIASRVANASDFANALGNAQGAQGAASAQAADADIETNMVALADEQLRYNAAATLLQRVYGQIRASVKGA